MAVLRSQYRFVHKQSVFAGAYYVISLYAGNQLTPRSTWKTNLPPPPWLRERLDPVLDG